MILTTETKKTLIYVLTLLKQVYDTTVDNDKREIEELSDSRFLRSSRRSGNSACTMQKPVQHDAQFFWLFFISPFIGYAILGAVALFISKLSKDDFTSIGFKTYPIISAGIVGLGIFLSLAAYDFYNDTFDGLRQDVHRNYEDPHTLGDYSQNNFIALAAIWSTIGMIDILTKVTTWLTKGTTSPLYTLLTVLNCVLTVTATVFSTVLFFMNIERYQPDMYRSLLDHYSNGQLINLNREDERINGCSFSLDNTVYLGVFTVRALDPDNCHTAIREEGVRCNRVDAIKHDTFDTNWDAEGFFKDLRTLTWMMFSLTTLALMKLLNLEQQRASTPEIVHPPQCFTYLQTIGEACKGIYGSWNILRDSKKDQREEHPQQEIAKRPKQ